MTVTEALFAGVAAFAAFANGFACFFAVTWPDDFPEAVFASGLGADFLDAILDFVADLLLLFFD